MLANVLESSGILLFNFLYEIIWSMFSDPDDFVCMHVVSNPNCFLCFYSPSSESISCATLVAVAISFYHLRLGFPLLLFPATIHCITVLSSINHCVE